MLKIYKMNKKIFIISFLLLVQLSFSQTMTKDELVTKLSDDACECSSKEKITKENFEMVLGLCMLQGISKYKSDFNFYYGNNAIGDNSAIESLGEDMGMKMATSCPAFINAMIDTGVAEKYISEELSEERETVISGKFTRLENNRFLTISLTEASGKKHELIVLSEFDNAFLITDNVLEDKTEVEVSYYLLDIYDNQVNKFITCKVISDITKK